MGIRISGGYSRTVEIKLGTEANLLTLPAAIRNQFPGFVAGDPIFGVAGANDIGVPMPLPSLMTWRSSG